ncbi:hypothetical protein [Streptomyces sp. NPDC058632]|uniref:hypothetical protein n=1 Tax=unclassified Streptomyces TaxID=2593676 RepID=UPI00365F263A
MSARSSSLVPGPLGQCTDAAPTVPDDLPGLPACLAQVLNPRRGQGRHHLLTLAGRTNSAAGLHHHTRDAGRPPITLGIM